MRGVRDLMINVTLFTLCGGAQLTCSAENRDFSIKNAGFVFAVEICNFSVFAYNFYSSNKYIVVKFCTEKLKNACRKLLNLRNKHSLFVPNVAIFILERNLIRGRFWSRARQPLLSRERVSRNQQNNWLWIVIFAKFHVNTWLPLNLKLNLFFSKSFTYHSGVVLQNLCSSKRETLKSSQKIQLGTGVRKVWRKCGFFKRFGPFFYDEHAKQDKIRCLFYLMLYCISKSCKIQVAKVVTKQQF